MVIARAALAATAALAVLLGVWWGSHHPVAVHPEGTAVLRLAWSARPERVERCREQTAEELARLPAHMRQPVVCEGETAAYRLQVRHDGRLLQERTVRGGGLRQDRRVYVFHEFRLPAGEARVEVRFDRLGPSGTRTTAGSGGPHVPPQLVFEDRVGFAPGQVVLVTYEPSRQELVALRRR